MILSILSISNWVVMLCAACIAVVRVDDFSCFSLSGASSCVFLVGNSTGEPSSTMTHDPSSSSSSSDNTLATGSSSDWHVNAGTGSRGDASSSTSSSRVCKSKHSNSDGCCIKLTTRHDSLAGVIMCQAEAKAYALMASAVATADAASPGPRAAASGYQTAAAAAEEDLFGTRGITAAMGSRGLEPALSGAPAAATTAQEQKAEGSEEAKLPLQTLISTSSNSSTTATSPKTKDTSSSSSNCGGGGGGVVFTCPLLLGHGLVTCEAGHHQSSMKEQQQEEDKGPASSCTLLPFLVTEILPEGFTSLSQLWQQQKIWEQQQQQQGQGRAAPVRQPGHPLVIIAVGLGKLLAMVHTLPWKPAGAWTASAAAPAATMAAMSAAPAAAVTAAVAPKAVPIEVASTALPRDAVSVASAATAASASAVVPRVACGEGGGAAEADVLRLSREVLEGAYWHDRHDRVWSSRLGLVTGGEDAAAENSGETAARGKGTVAAGIVAEVGAEGALVEVAPAAGDGVDVPYGHCLGRADKPSRGADAAVQSGGWGGAGVAAGEAETAEQQTTAAGVSGAAGAGGCGGDTPGMEGLSKWWPFLQFLKHRRQHILEVCEELLKEGAGEAAVMSDGGVAAARRLAAREKRLSRCASSPDHDRFDMASGSSSSDTTGSFAAVNITTNNTTLTSSSSGNSRNSSGKSSSSDDDDVEAEGDGVPDVLLEQLQHFLPEDFIELLLGPEGVMGGRQEQQKEQQPQQQVVVITAEGGGDALGLGKGAPVDKHVLPAPCLCHGDVMAGNVMVNGVGKSEGLEGGAEGTEAAAERRAAPAVAAADGEELAAADGEPVQLALIDFADCGHGDPLYDFVAVFVSALRCDMELFKECFRSYCEVVDVATLWPHRGTPACRQSQQQQQEHQGERQQQQQQQQTIKQEVQQLEDNQAGGEGRACGTDLIMSGSTGNRASTNSMTNSSSSSSGSYSHGAVSAAEAFSNKDPVAGESNSYAKMLTDPGSSSSSSSGRAAKQPAGPVARAFMCYVLLHEEEPAADVLAAASAAEVKRRASSWDEVAAELFGWMDQVVMGEPL